MTLYIGQHVEPQRRLPRVPRATDRPGASDPEAGARVRRRAPAGTIPAEPHFGVDLHGRFPVWRALLSPAECPRQGNRKTLPIETDYSLRSPHVGASFDTLVARHAVSWQLLCDIGLE